MSQFTGWDASLEDFDAIRSTAIPVGNAFDDLFGIPEEIDPRNWHRIENQMQVGSCQGWALSSVGEMCYHIATGEVIQFSAMWCYIMSQQLGGLHGDRGSRLIDGLKLAKTIGICPEEVYPYPGYYTTSIPAVAKVAAEPYKIRYHSVCQSYDQVFRFLAAGQGGVSIGLPWGGFAPDAYGVIEYFRRGNAGGHAMAFLGYSRRKDTQGRNYIWMGNSHSESWGNRGWSEVSPRFVEGALQEPTTVMIGMSDLSVPKRRKFPWGTKHVLA